MNEGAKNIAEMLKRNRTLKTIDLGIFRKFLRMKGGNLITDEGAKFIGESLKINHCLKTLGLCILYKG